ncbi:hypothetical protein DDB_G0268168 [Dictyostelium discoideum AX4]|uniref:Transglutaminase-like domain-containing protein n=1 Tax=Dictyostelium discoideum TaxID=44689 RepID=Q55FC8_DICDI|nr:hypothetical protein DDB_G0268168 [Dictyostelium discoideum AX4]EAL73537.1 hypothetical protein DDB_G0268168 [Dictyostelium discoideum AX4]|eukprot:XP_647605.1 hypothetical protein DDB_G0268168 [Dictyostelium discoideum AX4]
MNQSKTINLIYNDKEYLVEVENECTYEDFQILVFSVTDVDPTFQRFYYLSNSKLRDPSPTEKIIVLNNQKILLSNLKSFKLPIKIENGLKNKIEGMYRNMISYNSDRLQQMALDQVPLEIKKEKDLKRKMLMLLDWFKNEYFTWTNSPECSDIKCGTPSTSSVGSDRPTFEEQSHQVSIVEVYRCASNHVTRFPRYNSVEKLLSTKCGRCGEWANAFTLFSIALGFTTRYILDFTDHVWNEVYIDGRWIHVDSCEATYDSPLTYEGGWGKQLSYVFAFEFNGIYDVTSRYSIKLPHLNRYLISESDLTNYLNHLNHQIRSTLPFDELRSILNREFLEDNEKQSYHQRTYSSDLTGRISGSSEWRNNRGESGNNNQQQQQQQQQQSEIPIILKPIYSLDSISKARESLKLVGNCDITKNGICLTPDENDRVGGFWIKERIDIISNGGFICKFKFLIKTNGADGMAFVIQNDSINSLGIGGCGLGYQGIRNSIAIEFDTYPTKDHCKDPDGNHISIHTRSLEPNSSHHRFSLGYGNPKNNKPMNDGIEHECFIKYSTSNGDDGDSTIDVWLDKYQVLYKIKANIQKLLNLHENKSCFIGMTASTGGLKQAHIISGFSIGY